MRVGLVRNPVSHANRGRTRPVPEMDGVIYAEAPDRAAMAGALREFARHEVGLVALDGGDGSLRDMVTLLPETFDGAGPLLAVLPAGKTNLLARDLGLKSMDSLPLDRLLADALTGFANARIKTRRALDIVWTDGSHAPVSGFFFGAAAFRRATAMAQSVHRAGAFQQPAIALTLLGVLTRILTASADNPWRAGETIDLAADGLPAEPGPRFVVLASTLKRFPMWMRPFGDKEPTGVRYIDVDAPPHRLFPAAVTMVSGRDPPWLSARGYRRGESDRLDVRLDQPIIVDGEMFPGGPLTISAGRPLRFVVP